MSEENVSGDTAEDQLETGQSNTPGTGEGSPGNAEFARMRKSARDAEKQAKEWERKFQELSEKTKTDEDKRFDQSVADAVEAAVKPYKDQLAQRELTDDVLAELSKSSDKLPVSNLRALALAAIADQGLKPGDEVGDSVAAFVKGLGVKGPDALGGKPSGTAGVTEAEEACFTKAGFSMDGQIAFARKHGQQTADACAKKHGGAYLRRPA